MLYALLWLSTSCSISITGLVVLGGHTKVEDPHLNFRHAFSGTPTTGYGLANALYKITFSYAGYANAFNVVAEVKNPIRTIRRSAPASLLLVTVLYVLCNVAYFSAGEYGLPRRSMVLIISLSLQSLQKPCGLPHRPPPLYSSLRSSEHMPLRASTSWW